MVPDPGPWLLVPGPWFWSNNGPKSIKNGPKWCQDGVQDGLLGIRAVKSGQEAILDFDADHDADS